MLGLKTRLALAFHSLSSEAHMAVSRRCIITPWISDPTLSLVGAFGGNMHAIMPYDHTTAPSSHHHATILKVSFEK